MTHLLQKSKFLIPLLFASILVGCADYLNHRDSVTLGAGNAQEANSGIHESDPWPKEVFDTEIQVDGNRLPQSKSREKVNDGS
ncbi:MAG: hypothetical protein ACR2O3_15005 [Rhizobiaceae bacterium]